MMRFPRTWSVSERLRERKREILETFLDMWTGSAIMWAAWLHEHKSQTRVDCCTALAHLRDTKETSESLAKASRCRSQTFPTHQKWNLTGDLQRFGRQSLVWHPCWTSWLPLGAPRVPQDLPKSVPRQVPERPKSSKMRSQRRLGATLAPRPLLASSLDPLWHPLGGTRRPQDPPKAPKIEPKGSLNDSQTRQNHC